jgi:nitrite reductase/ring-hydroxylating ferredoxin subunit
MPIDMTRVICKWEELPDPSSRAFTLGAGDWPLRGFVVRRGEEVFGYLNRCPHAGHPHNWTSTDFLTQDQSLVMCRSHGACFDIATGMCVAGPCVGRELRSIAVKVEHGHVMLVGDPDQLAALLS